MKLSDIFFSFLIFVIFISIYFFNIFSVGIEDIKKNWPKYRCNPMVMPFASYFGHEPVSNFTQCIQTMQGSYMSTLLQPTNYVIHLFDNVGGNLMNNVNTIRKKIESVVSNLQNIISSILGIFMNIILQFQQILIKLKDTMGKTMGTVVTMVHLIEGATMTGSSIMAGPIGKTLNFVCFHPDTELILKNGEKKRMKDVSLGDVLSNGSVVYGTLRIKGNKQDTHENNIYYKIHSEKNNQDIYVTGTHLVRNKYGKFVPVSESNYGVPVPDIRTKEFSCLITDDHLIEIGEYTFWDWED